METADKERVHSTLTEKPVKIKVGKLTFKLRPLTLAQIYEIGAIGNELSDDDLGSKDKVKVLAEVIAHYKDAKVMQDMFIAALLPGKIKRFLFKRYVLKRLTVTVFNEFVAYVSRSLDVNFFLTSIIILRKTVEITNPSETTALGQ
ncbi:MAG: hypothetical protein IKZ87_02680 [Actinomycetaceae bacterium]|nr:hypothetical protein [Actinomycetaceae bacterium]